LLVSPVRVGEAIDLGGAVYMGAQFGLLMAIFLGTMQVIMVRKCPGREAVADPYSTTQALELNISMPYEKLFSLCLQYVTDKAGYTVSKSNPEKGLITARTPLTWKGLGNTFSINFSEIKDDSAKIRISSKPRLLIVMLDYGDNLGNVLRAGDYLKTNAH
ncbi:MAG: hypothetical protein WCK76_06830, partial [Elusimicrobiota bacterium]